jgi:hypothetical protein
MNTPNDPEIVQSPWTPVRTTKKPNEVSVEVCGRTYRFGPQAAMPTSVRTASQEILAGPIRLAGRLYGEEIEWKQPYVSLLKRNAREAVLCGTAETVGVITSVSVKVAYDGMIRFDVAVTPWLSNFRKGAERAAGLERLWVEIPLRPECATLYTYWPLDTGGVVSTMAPVNSGAVPEAGLTFPFKPFLWIGWEEGGLSWFAESDKGWQPADPNRAIEVIREKKRVTLRLHLLDSQPLAWQGNSDSWYKPNAPVTFTFGLQATPVKPMRADLAAHRIVHLHYYEPLEHVRIEQLQVAPKRKETVLDRVAASGANVVVLHEAWNNIQNYWVTDRADEIKATVKACHARGLKMLTYFGYEVSTLAPEWAELHERILIKNSDGRFRGGWQRLPSQRDYMVCYQSEWQERWLNGIAWMMDEYGIDGVYLDGTTTPSPCANGAHGCGYRHPDGSMHETFPIFAVRWLMERLHGIVKARNGVLTAHQSSCCVTPTLEFCDTYWDGEHIGGAFKHGEDGRFPLAVFRAEFMGHNFGVPAEFLSHSPQSLAYTLLHDVPVRPGKGELLDAVASVWKAFGQFGTSQAAWLPYWRNRHLVTASNPHVHVSAYARENRLLLVVSNLSKDQTVDASIALKSKAVKHGRNYTRARDAVKGSALAIRSNRLSLRCGPMSWKLIEVK